MSHASQRCRFSRSTVWPVMAVVLTCLASGPARSATAPAPVTAPLTPELDLQVGHSGDVNEVAFAPDVRTLATAGADKMVKLWDARTGALLHTLADHTATVLALAFSPDGSVLMTATFDTRKPLGLGQVHLWNARTGAFVRSLTVGASHPMYFSPRGDTLASIGADAVELWDVAGALKVGGTSQRTLTLTTHTNVAGVVFSRDGSLLAGASLDGTVEIWDTRTGTLQRTLTIRPGRLMALALSPNGKTLATVRLGAREIATGTQPEEVTMWDVATGAPGRALTELGSGLSSSAFDVTFAPDGKLLAGAGPDGKLKLWDAHTGELLQALTTPGAATNMLLTHFFFAPDGKTLATTGDLDHTVKLWDVPTHQWRRTLAGRSDYVLALAFSPDGAALESVYYDVSRANTLGARREWDTRTGALRRTRPGQGAAMSFEAISADGRVKAVLSTKDLAIVDTATGKVQLPVQWPGGGTLVLSPDGKILASGGFGSPLQLWDVATGALQRTLEARSRGPQPLAFSPDGATLASGNDGNAKLWDTATGTLKRTVASQTIFAVAFSPDGTRLAGGGWDTVTLWDAGSGALERTLTGHIGEVMAVAFSHDGRLLASGGSDTTVKVWDVAKGKLLVTLLALPAAARTEVNAATTQPAGGVAPAVDANVAPVEDYLVLTPEGYYAGSAAADRYVRFRLGNDSFPAESFQARYYRPDLVKQALAGQELPPIGAFKGPVPPWLTFTSPTGDSKLSGDTANVTVETSDDSDIKSVAFFVNGTRVDAKAITADARALTADAKLQLAAGPDIPAAHKVTRRFTATIPLPPGGTTVKLQTIAFDDDGLQSPREEILFTRDKTASVTGKLLGLGVGVSHYQDPRLNLQFAAADATALTDALSQLRGIYSSASVTALTNEQATRDGVRMALDKLVAQTTRNDTVVILLSGHGWRSDERSFYFATYEVNRNDVANTALPWSDVVQRLTQLSQKSKRVLVLLDACHSGSAATNEELVKAVLSANAGVMVLASSKGSEVSLENAAWAHGAFTKAILEAIAGQAAPAGERSVSLFDFESYVRRRVKILTEDTQHPQVPFLQDFDTDAAIVAKP